MKQETNEVSTKKCKKFYTRVWFWVLIILGTPVLYVIGFVAVYVSANPGHSFEYYVTGCEPSDEFYDICSTFGSEGGVFTELKYHLFPSSQGRATIDKPVIYFYPETTTDVTVELDYDGTLIADYPPYDEVLGGWRVTAEPDSTLINHADGLEYSYIFWEGKSRVPIEWDLSTGFIVKGSDTRDFLQEKLAEIGLTPKEYNEFIVYWYPKMMNNPYNLIHFASEQYTDTAPLTITPTPDSMLRVFMVYKPLAQPIEVMPQTFTPFTRTGFSVVEWGGAEVRYEIELSTFDRVFQ